MQTWPLVPLFPILRYSKMRKNERAPEVSYQALRAGPGLYAPRELAALLHVHPRTIVNWIHSGRLGAIRLSERTYRITRSAVVKLLYPERVIRRPIRRSGAIPTIGGAERLGAGPRRRSRVAS